MHKIALETDPSIIYTIQQPLVITQVKSHIQLSCYFPMFPIKRESNEFTLNFFRAYSMAYILIGKINNLATFENDLQINHKNGMSYKHNHSKLCEVLDSSFLLSGMSSFEKYA